MPQFPDSVDDKLVVDGLNLRSTENYTLEAVNGKILDLCGDVRVNGVNVITEDELESYIHTFDVKQDYNAVGDGVADDTSAIQNAINAASAAGGGTVIFPRGTYLISSTLLVPSYVTLEGVSEPHRAEEYSISISNKASRIVQNVTSTMLANSDSVNGNVSIKIKNLRFQHDSATGSNPVILFTKVRRSVITESVIALPDVNTHTTRSGINFTGGSEHNYVLLTRTENCGINADASNRIAIVKCEISHGGIKLASGYDNIVLDCDLYNDNIVGAFPQYENMISLDGLVGALIQGNQLVYAPRHGIYLVNACVKCLIVSNQVKASSKEVPNSWSGICLDGNPTDNLIANNQCWGAPTVGGLAIQAYGIQASTAAGKVNLITGNVLLNNTVAPARQDAGAVNVWFNNLGTLYGTVASAATITIPPGADLVNVTGTTTITSIAAGFSGQRVTLTFAGVLTVTDGSNLKLYSNFVTAADDTLSLICDGTNWYEISRSVDTVADGDRGDITVSANGATWTIDNDAVTTIKILDSNVTNSKLATNSVTNSKLDNDSVRTPEIQDGVVTYAKFNADAKYRAISTQTGTTYTFVLTDADFKYQRFTNAAGCTVTVPANATVAFPIGTELIGVGTVGTVTFSAAGGVTINNVGGLTTTVMVRFKLLKVATDAWDLTKG